MFGSFVYKANAKLNLCLDIIGIRPDGYHLIESIMQSVGICDIVSVKKNKKSEIRVFCKGMDIPEEKNIAYKAAKLFFETANITNKGVIIKIKKNIPAQAGMGGGSADAAAVLIALNEIFKTNYSTEELCNIGEKVGADVPFCIKGGTQFVRGIGEILTKLEDCPPCYFVVVKGNEGVSTKEAYEDFDRAENLPPLRIEKVIELLATGDFSALQNKLINVFEKSTRLSCISKTIQRLKECGAIEAAMTGSGSAVFGIFRTKSEAKKCLKAVKNEFPFAAVTKPVVFGVEKSF